jgi:hypothetical protein
VAHKAVARVTETEAKARRVRGASDRYGGEGAVAVTEAKAAPRVARVAGAQASVSAAEQPSVDSPSFSPFILSVCP